MCKYNKLYILYNDLFIYDKICKYIYSKLTILKCKYIFYILENNNYNYRRLSRICNIHSYWFYKLLN